MKIFKSNSYDILMIYLGQIVISIFALAVYFLVSMIPGYENLGFINIIASVFAVGFYCVIVYSSTWQLASADRIKIDSGRYEYIKTKGLFLGLFANIPNIIVSLLNIFAVSMYLLGCGEFFKGMTAAVSTVQKLHSALYFGFIHGITPKQVEGAVNYGDIVVESILYLVLPIIVIATIQFAYSMGTRNKRIINKAPKEKKEK